MGCIIYLQTVALWREKGVLWGSCWHPAAYIPSPVASCGLPGFASPVTALLISIGHFIPHRASQKILCLSRPREEAKTHIQTISSKSTCLKDRAPKSVELCMQSSCHVGHLASATCSFGVLRDLCIRARRQNFKYSKNNTKKCVVQM